MKKLLIITSLLLFGLNSHAADFVLELKPAANSVSNTEVANDALSISKILNLQLNLDAKANSSSLGSLSTKSTITDSEVSDGALSFSKIFNFVNEVLNAVKGDAVYLRYYSNSGQTINTSFTRVNFGTEAYNSHPGSVVVGTNWEFTAPKDGCYETKGRLHIAAVTTSSDFQVKIYYNGVAVDAPYSFSQVGSGFVRLSVSSWSTEHCLLQGQKIYVNARNNPDARAVSIDPAEVWISIRKVN